MPKISFEKANGEVETFEAEEGASILDVAHDHNIDIEGACGGNLSCATCHVVVDAEWYDKLPPVEAEEEDMLDLAFGVEPTSRLGCQCRLTKALDGIKVKLVDA